MKTEETPAFSAVLRQHRVASGLTHEQLAERAGLSVRGISDLERGVRAQPRAYTVHQLADALNLTTEDRAIFQAAARAETAAQPDEDLSSILGVPPTGELIGREEEQERLRTALDGVHEQGAGQVVLLSGELGIGKTRLLQGAMIEARVRGDVVLAARCAESSQRIALRPFVEALGRLAAAPPPGLRVEIQRSWKRVARMLAGCPADDADDSGRGAIEQEELFRAVTDFLLLSGRSQPVAVVLDDLHWADERSLLLLVHLARVTRVAPLLLLGAFRDMRVTEEHPALARTIQHLGQERLADRLSIRRLSLEETTRLVESLMGDQPVSEEFASFVYRRTKGIPRLIEQLVRSLGGRLELEGEIGAGSMGRVFRAYDRDREEEVAAKLVLARSEMDIDTLLRFQQEGAVLARLHHPHIVRIHDTFAEEHASCIIMELLDGHSLGQILQAGPLPLDRATAIALKVVDALSYAHSQEIVHRDIKPDNVMVLEGDQVKVTDFGIARILQPDTSPQTIATTGMRMGTPLYMAPEQIAGKKIDRRADVYALGCMLYHMVTGRPPFEGADALAVAVQQLQDEPQPPSTLNHDVPEEWDAVILKALEKEPARRFQSARELGQAIADLPKGPGEGTRSPSRTRNRVALAITGLLLVLLAMVIVLRMTQSNSSRLSARGATSTPVLASGPITALANGTEIDAYLQHANFRGYMLFEKGGRTILSKGYGMADSEHRAPNVAQTKWPMFGVNEFMVAVAIMKLQEESKLSIHDHICRYIRACPAAWHPITIKELLSDSSGIDVYDPFRGSSGLAQTMAACRAMPLVSRPGAPSARSHCNPLLLSTIVERVTHQPWALAMQRLVFGPAGMTDTGQLTNALQPPEIARGYRFGSPQTDLNYYSYPMAYSTVEDIRRFDHALLAGKLISEQSRQTMFTALWSASSGDPVSQGLGTYIQTGQFTPTSHLALNHVPFQESSGDSDFGEEAGIRVDNAFCPANGSIWIYVTNDPGLFTNVDENHLIDLTAKLLWAK